MRAPGGWAKQRLNPNRKSLGREVGRKGVVMFPTSHDITPRYLSRSVSENGQEPPGQTTAC